MGVGLRQKGWMQYKKLPLIRHFYQLYWLIETRPLNPSEPDYNALESQLTRFSLSSFTGIFKRLCYLPYCVLPRIVLC